jgi:hypothetical protein
MSIRTTALSIVTLLTLNLAAQGGGGGSSGAGASGSAAATGGTAGASNATGGTIAAPSATGGTQDTPPGRTGGTASGNPASNQVSTQQLKQIQQNQRNAVITGANTRPSPQGSGTVSAPGVGVGHAANGLPIGSPGSGLGSRENSVGPTKPTK